MDDYVVSNLNESKNEWAMRLVTILTPLIIQGLKSIFIEADRLCKENDEEDKYLMTFQNLLANIPHWSSATIDEETNRIEASSNCNYLTDLISCVHIIQLKILTCVRVGQKQKPISINVPSLKNFIHKVYINIARQLYSNIYLFEKNIPPLQIQKNNRELDVITRECILNTVRDNIPVEEILKAYLDETSEEFEEDLPKVEQKVEPKVESKQESNEITSNENTSNENTSSITSSNTNTTIESTTSTDTYDINTVNTVIPSAVPSHITNDNEGTTVSSQTLSFSDIDNSIDINNKKEEIYAPKTIERLEEISNSKPSDDDDDDEDKIQILDNNVSLDISNIDDLSSDNKIKLDDIETLE